MTDGWQPRGHAQFVSIQVEAAVKVTIGAGGAQATTQRMSLMIR